MRWALLFLVGCGFGGSTSNGTGDDTAPMPTVFDTATKRVVYEIDYEQGQEPYTGPILGFGDTFDVMTANIDRLFAGKKTLVIPRTVGDMENIGDVPDEELTATDILAIAAAHRGQHDAAGVKTYYIVFVSGHYADAGGVQSGVLGVSFGGTDVIAMFKDVIRSTNIPAFPNVVRYVEQSTMVHEGAHAIGLVDNGVPMASQHKDAAHGAHCNNDKCVMYWLNEGATDAAQFAQMSVVAGNSILFDTACLDDVDVLTGGP